MQYMQYVHVFCRYSTASTITVDISLSLDNHMIAKVLCILFITPILISI